MKCYAPWHALSIRFNGDVVPDCVYTGRHGNLLSQSLLEVLEHPGLLETQKQIKEGCLPNSCSQCSLKENTNGHSRRKFFEQVLNPLVKPESKGKTDIYFLEFNMSNVCNLKCRMCSGVNSTAWIKEDLKLQNLGIARPINHPDFGYKNISEKIVDKLFEFPEYFKNLKYVNIKGGEPYMEPANKKIMHKLINLGVARNCILDISTNGTIIDEEFDNLALQFKETKWHVSMEGINSLYEYIRGGNNFTFKEFEHNLQTFSKFDRVILAGTVMAYNVCHLKEIEKWFNTIKQQNFELYFSNVVTQPAYLNPSLLPNSILKDTDYVNNQHLSNQLPIFIKYTRALDEIRKTNVLDVCPELEELFT